MKSLKLGLLVVVSFLFAGCPEDDPDYLLGLQEGEAVGSILRKICLYGEATGGYPETLEILDVQEDLETVGIDRLEYTSPDPQHFLLRFAGRDRRLNSGDDYLYTESEC